jgi:hypothetical protein
LPKFKKPCLICGQLSYGSHCEEHAYQIQQVRDARKNTPARRAKKKALYGGDYQQRRKIALAGATHCYLCHEAFTLTDRIEADHLIPTNPQSPLVAVHRLCNQRKGNKGSLA